MDATPKQVIELAISNLSLSLEDALRRLEAYHQVVTKHAPPLLNDVDALDQSLADSSPNPKSIALHTRVIQAVRDQDITALSESIADLRGSARLRQRQGRAK